jgi:non-ribosomal peptide synthetase-like protein
MARHLTEKAAHRFRRSAGNHLRLNDGRGVTPDRSAADTVTAPAYTNEASDKVVSNAIRWNQGERLDHYFEERCDSVPVDHLAVITEEVSFTYRQLDEHANQTARYLIEQGIRPGDRVGVLFDKSIHGYVALLAILKAGAAYVPLDPAFPQDRVSFIIQDSGIQVIVSVSRYQDALAPFGVKVVYVDAALEQIDAKPNRRLAGNEVPPPESDQLFYIIYTSGTTGKPKGVALDHAGICNFVKVAGEVYGYAESDRCYQGMTLAFDFHVEDLWTPLIRGVTLVAGKSGASLFGADLHAHLQQHHVTILPCVPTLWATIEEDLPEVRIIQLSGEAVPHNLVAKWHRPDRLILNAYGPTECSVSSTLKALAPGKPVTIGVPLPTYTAVVLDEDAPIQLAHGAVGEIGIAGICLARGYLNRADLTERKFIPDFLSLPNNPSGRIYRTGDYGRVRDDGELEFHGRIDTQVKLRGYRIELGEIEAVLAQLPQISQAVVNPHETELGATELVAYYTRKQGASAVSLPEVAENLRRQLPPYMIPGYLEELDFIPMTTNHKADRKALPDPKGPRFSVSSTIFVQPRSDVEKALCGALAGVMNIERISITDNFFQDLGGHSLLMARFAAEIRRTLQVRDVSIRDIYLNPTIEKLAVHIESMGADSENDVVGPNSTAFHLPSNFDYWRCGTLQLAWFVGVAVLSLWLLVLGVQWAYAAMPDLYTTFFRIFAYSVGVFVVFSAVPIALKWSLIGRWKEESIPIWSMRYFRFWLVKASIRVAPMALVEGPLRNLYMRMLGAKVGANAVIQSAFPICTDLIEIGTDAVLEKDTIVQGYRAQSNYIQTGCVHIGARAVVCEAGVVDINTVMEDDTQLGFASSLHTGQVIPRGKHYHGTPAVETSADYCVIEPKNCSGRRRWAYALGALITDLLIVDAPMVTALGSYPYIRDYLGDFSRALADTPELWAMIGRMMIGSLEVFMVGITAALLAIGVIPRLLNLFLESGKTYVLYGFHYYLHRRIVAMTNNVFYNRLFGDSSASVHYARWLGYKMNTIIQTGSNFGMGQRHENPFMCDIGTGTMISGGLKMINETTSAHAFRLDVVKIGERNYLGNYLHYPADATVGINCLLATKALTPIDGPVRHDTGLLGSPAFDIPRATARDLEMSRMDDDDRRRRLRAKNRYDSLTAVLYLLNAWFLVFIESSFSLVAVAFYPLYGMTSTIVIGAIGFSTGIAWMWFAERGVLKFGSLSPQIVPLLDKYFWYHERVWKLTSLWAVSPFFVGTPFKNLLTRMEGVRLGKMVFDDGASIDEYTMVEIGDYTNLNAQCVIQPHSLEEAVFKSGRVKLGAGCTLGCASNLHYDITMGDFVAIEPNAFVMKGECVEADSTWQGNPARSVGGRAVPASVSGK